jgi:MFS family permease
MQRRAIIFLIVFIDLIGFGIVLPMLPLYAERFGAKGLIIGLIVASFSIMQVIFSPFWGRLSDRIGRRPVLLISVGTGVLSYILFAIGSSLGGNLALTLILLSRIFAGACGGNINVTQA